MESLIADNKKDTGTQRRGSYSLRRQVAWVSLGRIAAALIQAGTVVLVARNATTTEFGIFAAAYGVVIVAQVLTDVGLSTFITKERSRSVDSPLVGGAIRLNGHIAVLALVGGVAACLALAPVTDGYSVVFVPYVVWALAERNAAAWLAVAFADGDAWLNMTNLVGRRLLTLVGLIILVANGVDAVLAFGIAAAVGGVCSLVVARLYLRRRVRGPASRDTRTILRSSVPFWSNLVAGQLRNLDVLLVATVAAGATQAGLYGAGARITGPLRILPDALAAALLPAASRPGFRPTPKLLRQLGLFVLVASAFGLVAVVLVPYVVQPLLGPAYAGAELVIQLTVLGLPFASLVSVEASLLQGLGRQTFVARVAFGATAICLCGVGVGAVVGGAVGATIGYTVGVVAQAIVLTVTTWFVVRNPPPIPVEAPAAAPVVSTGLDG